MTAIWHGAGDDVRFAIRGLRRTPLFTATMILTLALGVGLFAGILSFADGYLFRPLPFRGADRAYYLRDPNAPIRLLKASDARILRESPLAPYGFVQWGNDNELSQLDAGHGMQPVFAYEVSPGFRRTLELPLVAGRDFQPEDHAEGAPLVAWLSHRYWQRTFGGDPNVVNRVLPARVTGARSEIRIVGVLGREVTTFDLNNEPPDLVLAERGRPKEGPNNLAEPIARLPEGVTVEQAAAAIGSVLQAGAPAKDGRPRVVRLVSFDRAQRGGGAPTARILFAGAMLVMLLAALNLVHLLLGKGEMRTGDAATRIALGASRWRVVRAFLIESLLLGGTGIALGLLAGKAMSAVISASIPGLPTAGRNLAMMAVLFDARVMAIAAGFGLLAAVAGGFWPAHRAWRLGLDARLRGSTRRTRGLARVILASELAVVTVVGVGAAFAGTGIYRYLNKPLGYDFIDRVQIDLIRPGGPLTDKDRVAVLSALRGTPGVRYAAAGTVALPGQESLEVPGVSIDTKAMRPQGAPPDLFEAWNWKLVAGRWFDPGEFNSQDVAVVNEPLARVAWPSGGAVGASIRTGSQLRRVVGVVQGHQWRLDSSLQPEVFVPAPPAAGRSSLVAWVPDAVEGDIEKRLKGIAEAAAPGITASAFLNTFETRFARGIGEAQFQWPIVSAFGVMAACLALVGVFGIISFLVSQRTREFGIRLALGARRIDVKLAVLRDSVVPAAFGLLIGSLVAWLLGRTIESAVFGWEASGVQSIAIVAASVLTVSVIAAISPAARAARTDPAGSLRDH